MKRIPQLRFAGRNQTCTWWALFFTHTKHTSVKIIFPKMFHEMIERRIDSPKKKRKQLQNTVWMLWFCSFRKDRVFCFWFKNDVDTLKRKVFQQIHQFEETFLCSFFAIEISNRLSCKEKELGDLIDFWNRQVATTTPNKHGALPL